MKYTTLEYDLNKPAPKQVTVPLDSDYGLAVKVIQNGEQVQLSSGQMTIDGIQEAGAKDGWLQYELSSGSTPCTLRKQFQIKTGEASPLSGFDEIKEYHVQATSLTINGSARLPSSTAISPSEIREWYADCRLSGEDGLLSTWTISYKNNPNFIVSISRDSYFVNDDGLWQHTRSGATREQLTFAAAQPMKLTMDTSSMLSSYLTVKYVMNSRPAPDPIRLDLAVQEKDLGYFEIPDLRPEPEPEPPTDPVEVHGYYGEYSDSTLYSGDAIIEEEFTLPADAVMLFDCSVNEEPVTDFMRIVVCTADGNWFTKPGDQTYGGLWYEAEGGTGRTAESITLTPETKFALLHAEDEESTVWTLTYDRNKLPE